MATGLAQLAVYLVLVGILAVPLGHYIAWVLDGRARWLRAVEAIVYRAGGVDPGAAMSWRSYALAVVALNGAGLVLLYALLRIQGLLPLNPQRLPGVPPYLSLNTAVSFVTNTNWQNYAGESTLSPLAQALGLGVQNFLSAATGLAVLGAMARAIARKCAGEIGNAWVDITRVVLYVLMPLSIVLALALAWQGVVQSASPYRTVQLQHPVRTSDGRLVTTQRVPLGLAASQVAIKQLGTNGGGYMSANSAHPLENPTPLTNLLECIAILLIPAAQCVAFGRMVGDRRQGRALLATCAILFVVFAVATQAAERHGNPMLTRMGLTTSANWEGKETRVGIGPSAIWAVATTAASSGSVNAMHDSFTPLGGLAPMMLIQLGEVVFGGVGSGLYGLLAFVIVAVFVSGLMVGRTPEYLGKKIGAFEMKMVSLIILLPCALTLICTAAAALASSAAPSTSNPGPHGFSELLYAYSSMSNNNGSAFAGFLGDSPFHNVLGAVAMFLGRFWIIVPVLAIAGSLARKNIVPVSTGTLPTHTPLFVGLLCSVIVLVGVLTFLPALALGPIIEHLRMTAVVTR